MKTLWLFINMQILGWAVGMTLAERYLETEYPKAAYITAGGSFLAGMAGFLWLSPKIEALTTFERVLVLVIFVGGLFYLPVIFKLLEAKWITS